MSTAISRYPTPLPLSAPDPSTAYAQRRDQVMRAFDLHADDAGLLLALGLSDEEIGIASAVIYLGLGPLTVRNMRAGGIPAEHWVACAWEYRERIRAALGG